MKENQADVRKHILIVEDDRVFQRICSLAVTKLGYRPDIVDRVDKAKKNLLEKTYDCIILDLGLPDESGDILIPIIRQNTQNKETPIIVISAHVDNELKKKCLFFGANLVRVKPFPFDDLADTIKNFVELDD